MCLLYWFFFSFSFSMLQINSNGLFICECAEQETRVKRALNMPSKLECLSINALFSLSHCLALLSWLVFMALSMRNTSDIKTESPRIPSQLKLKWIQLNSIVTVFAGDIFSVHIMPARNSHILSVSLSFLQLSSLDSGDNPNYRHLRLKSNVAY